MPPSEYKPKSLVILVADGARPDTLNKAIEDGHLPALKALRDEGETHTITSVFPSVTGPAYAPFLMGLYPGKAGVPGIRWWDRSKRQTMWPAYARSYVGMEALKADRDLNPDYPTLFELAANPLGAFTPHGRGLQKHQRIGASLFFGARMGWTHFRGDLKGWLKLDSELGHRVAARIRRDKPDFAFLAHPGIDKLSHQLGHSAPEVLDAMRTVDRTAAEIRHDAQQDGRWDSMEIWIVSDHGHSPVAQHEDLAGLLAEWRLSTLAHPWVFTSARDAAVMVSGNAMAHIYLELERDARPWWPDLKARWNWLVERLLERESIDLIVLPVSPNSVQVHGRERGMAEVTRLPSGHYTYSPISGDPLQLSERHEDLTRQQAYDLTITTDYPDSIVQIVALANSERSGELIVSAAPNWDLRAHYEPIPHVSSHGALHKEHMLVPLITSGKNRVTPRRTVDIFPSALKLLGRGHTLPTDGESFR